MNDLISTIARPLVDDPDQVSVSEVEESYTTVLELTVAKSDIGKKGQTARAIRTILSAVSGKTKKRAVMEIIG